jgi:hypothetical protein
LGTNDTAGPAIAMIEFYVERGYDLKTGQHIPDEDW